MPSPQSAGRPEPVRLLTADQVHRCLSVAQCIDVLDRAFRMSSDGAASFVGGVKTARGKFHVKSALAHVGRPLFAAKLNANFPENPRTTGLPTIQGVLVLSDAEDGSLLAIMDSSAITAIRTAAASGVVARQVARGESRVLALIGCGVQARMHLDAMRAVLPITHVRAHDADPAAADRLATVVRAHGLGASVASSLAQCTEDADVIVTCTTSGTPFLSSEHVRPGCFVAAVGADNPDKSEIMPELLARAAVIVDDAEQCAQMGDLHHALEAGVMQRSDVWSTMSDVIRGSAPPPRDRPIVFDSTGVPLEDVAAAAAVFDRATRDDVGGAFALS